MSDRFIEKLLRWLAIALAVGVTAELIARLIVEVLWFEKLGYLPIFLKRLEGQIGLWAATTGISLLFLLGNLRLARRLAWQHIGEESLLPSPRPSSLTNSPSILPQSPTIRLSYLLGMIVGFGLLVAAMLVYYLQVALTVWRPDYSLPTITPPLPSAFSLTRFSPVFLQQIPDEIWQLGLIAAFVFLLLLQQGFWLRAIAWALSLIFGLVLSGNWTRFLLYWQPVPFGVDDPLFQNDIGFYVFRLPVWQLLDFWLGGLFLYGVLAVGWTYLVSGDSFSQGKFPGFSRPQLRHLYGLVGAVFLILGLHHWLQRYELLYSSRGVAYGASFTDVQVQLSLETFLSVAAWGIGLWLLVKGATGLGKYHSRRRSRWLFFSPWPFAVYLVLFVGGAIATEGIQRLRVEPNELNLERPFIERSIAFTRDAFDLDDIDIYTFDPTGTLTAEDIAANDLTIDNIRLWDTRPILQTNRQLQQIRLYYKFSDADIDRYTFLSEATETEERPEEVGEDRAAVLSSKQQVIVAARELDYQAVPEQGKTWINKHLFYTHGYGFTMSPVNSVAEGGLPFYFVKDIGTGAAEGALETANAAIRESIPIGEPRIYYGELTDNYVMTNTRVLEFDFPSGDENVYFSYDGTGGIPIGSLWRRLAFALYLKDWKMLFTDNFTPDTRLLLRRNINVRVREIAPFLRFDRDPYLVVADGENLVPGGPEHFLYWIIDAYTTSDRYPYSDPGDSGFNYIRNSVKIVVDAYNGTVKLYVANAADPIIQTWQQIFPDLFESLTAMPAALRSHIRYPRDLFNTQSQRLLTYHMTDPQVFYNREDQWEIPQEIYGSELQAVEPYYVIVKLPTAPDEEFILLHLYTPTARPNLIAWMAGRSDGDNYGRLLLYQFPKQELVFGPNQIEALINQDPIISQQISLWNREGSKVLQGNLLVIPIEESLLYVEPLYLVAEQNSLPILARVIVVYNNRIVMAETLEQALQTIFSPDRPMTPAVVRPVEQLAPALPGAVSPESSPEPATAPVP